MTDKFKTYVITDPTQTSFSFTLGPTGLTGYDGFLYLLMGTGGYGGNYPNITPPQGGGAGFINAGYVDLNYPYTVREINVDSSGSSTNLSINYTGPNIDPTNGNNPFILKADEGQYKYLNAISGVSSELVSGFYSGANTFSPSSTPTLINQRSVSSEGQGASGPTGPRGFVTNDFGQGNGPTGIFGGGGFYGGTNGPTGPFGFSSGGWYDTNGATGSVGTLGYAIITLIPSSLVNNTSFLTGSTGTIGNTGLYLYSLLGGGGGGSAGGGGGSGDIRCGVINNSGIISYEVGAGGTPGVAGGGDTTISTDNFITAITAKGGMKAPSTSFTGGAGFFAGGISGPSASLIEGQSYANLPSNFTIGTNGAGSVNNNFGRGGGTDGSGNEAGGGGGPYGGNFNASGSGYGCGGGGDVNAIHNGSGGYAILKQLIQNNFKYMNITSATTILPPTFYTYTGVWGFMDAPFNFPSYTNISKSYFNTFHFLIKEDNVQKIDIVKDTNNYFTTTISFSRLNNKVQQFKMTGTDPSPYMYLVFYA